MKYCINQALVSFTIEESIGVSSETTGVIWIYIKDYKGRVLLILVF